MARNPFMNARPSAGGANPFMRQAPTARQEPMPTPQTGGRAPLTGQQRAQIDAARAQGVTAPSMAQPGALMGRLNSLVGNRSMPGPLGAPGPGPTTGPQPIGPSSLNAEQRATYDAARAEMMNRPMMGPGSASSVNTTTTQDMLGGRRNMGGNPLAGGMGGLAAAMGRPSAFKKGGAVKAAPVKKKAGGVVAKPKAAPVKAKGKSMPAFKKGGVVKKGRK